MKPARVADIPEDVRAFVRRRIDSVELLNVLLMLRENAERRASSPSGAILFAIVDRNRR